MIGLKTEITVFNYRFYLKEVLLLFFSYLIMEDIFSWIIVPHSDILSVCKKMLSIFIYSFTLFYFKDLKREEKLYVGLFTLLMVKLVFESLYQYGNFFNQFSIFTVIYPVIFTVFSKYLFRKLNIDLLEFVAKFYLYTYLLFMLLYGSGFSFSLDMIEMEDYGPFSGDTRIIHARSVFMLIIPFLWYLNQYLKMPKIKVLVPFIIVLVAIIIHQHRSVWSCTIAATFLFFILCAKWYKPAVMKGLKFSFFSFIIILICYFFILNLYPNVIPFFADRFSEIFNPAKEGSTGNFRLDQSAVYGQYILEKPFLGWSFEGFQMSNPLVDWWEENTGHHFHQGFIEILFYHGVFGLMLKYSFLLIILIKSFTKKLSQEAIILSSFCVSGALFSFNYVLPLVFWGHVGLCLYYLETKNICDDLYSDSSI